jgi:hypothetical protein
VRMRTCRHRVIRMACAFLAFAPFRCAANDLLEQGYKDMYSLAFNDAHRCFRAWEQSHPDDPMGPVSDAAAYLFSEFNRLKILHSEFFVNNHTFFTERTGTPDAAVRRSFEGALARTEELAESVLRRSPDDQRALLATVLRLALQADYMALIDKRYLAALREVKQARTKAEQLLTKHPDCYDAYLAVGLENYLLSLKPAPVRWLLRMNGAQTDKQTGLAKLRLTAEKGHYLEPYAKLLLAVAALRDNNKAEAKRLLTNLTTRFPRNQLYREELKKVAVGT